MSPSDAKSKLVGDTVTEVATGAGGVVGAVVLSPHPVRSKTATRLWSLKLKGFLGFQDHMPHKMQCGFDFPLPGTRTSERKSELGAPTKGTSPTPGEPESKSWPNHQNYWAR